jgi:MFS transporter, PPP family, 3-phenylpropionic acid transporter
MQGSRATYDARHMEPARGEDVATLDLRLRRLYALVWMVASGFLPFFVLWLNGRGFTPSEIGLILGATAVAAVAAAPFWSHAADRRWGTTRTLRRSLIAAAVSTLVLAATGSALVPVIGAVALLSTSTSAVTPLTDALAVATLGPDRLHTYGAFRLWASVGWGVGAIAFGAVFEVAGLAWLLPLYAAGLLACALYVGLFPRVRPAPVRTDARLGSFGDAIAHVPRLPLYLLGLLTFGASQHAAWDFVPLRIQSAGGGPFLVGVAAGVAAFVEIPFMRSSAALISRFGTRALFVAGGALYVAASLGWAAATAPAAVTAVRIAVGIGFGLTYVSIVVMTGRLVPEPLRNTGQTLAQMCTAGVAPMVGSLIGGWVYEHIGPPQMFIGTAAGLTVATAIVWIATKDLAAS